MEIPFLNEKIKPGFHFHPKEILSTLIPLSDLPEPMYSTSFFIERVERDYYLRNVLNPFYCSRLRIENHEFNASKYNENTGEVGVEVVKCSILLACFEGEFRTVGYFLEDKFDLFLPFFKTDKTHEQVDSRLNWLYEAARMGTLYGLRYLEQQSKDRVKAAKGLTTRLEPKGPWEEQMFRDVFDSDPNLMSDDEYEMIFGIER